MRLEDTDGDGRFDKSTVFADKMMFPEGAMWYDGSLYVGAPPHIWKLTDADGDGVAEKREQWFVGQTLGGCANDMHGPYLGPDGWIYWCKGEFAQATYEQFKGPPLVSRAAHIFRRRPEGGLVEPVLTGGMNNPVEVAFSTSGERFLSGTFFETPAYLKRDGLIHSIYGGVYGKPDNSVHGFPRTGPLMPTMTQMGAAAACGLACLETNGLGPGFAGNLLACQFNMHKVSRHVLVPHEATFTTKDQDFVTSPDVDFHPTDVIEDADGSVLVIDTGGWYKVCCPTSQLHKPDILGGIYRISRIDAHPPADPRGAKLEWTKLDAGQLAALLADERPAVRHRAQAMLAKLGAAAIEPLSQLLKTSTSPAARCMAVWTLTRIPLLAARAAVHPALADADEQVRQAACHSAAAWRDAGATEGLLALLSKNSVPNRRVAAEALGRIGNAAAVPAILTAAAEGHGQSLEHSLIYALIEFDAPAATRLGLSAASPYTRRAALVALDQMPHRSLKMDDVSPLLASTDAPLRDAAWWIVERHPDWSGAVVPQFRSEVFDRKITPAATAMLLGRLR
ncbi:MAG: HEAT repeat domain-containing protein, partial [Planctomycetia bacterium]|nr:HEAT repeat domain-containing protein [Planctomycetia bacterium]